jgi:hypothetical protein
MIEALNSSTAETVELAPGMLPQGMLSTINNWLSGLKADQDQPSE